MIFVNESKRVRAKEIVDFLLGEKIPQIDNEVERVNKFSKILNEAKIEPKDREKAEMYIYEKLGGLLRTEEDHKKALKLAEEAQKKGKKRMIE